MVNLTYIKDIEHDFKIYRVESSRYYNGVYGCRKANFTIFVGVYFEGEVFDRSQNRQSNSLEFEVGRYFEALK
jgi:hypothetical protein